MSATFLQVFSITHNIRYTGRERTEVKWERVGALDRVREMKSGRRLKMTYGEVQIKIKFFLESTDKCDF